MWGKTAEIKSSSVVNTKPARFRGCGISHRYSTHCWLLLRVSNTAGAEATLWTEAAWAKHRAFLWSHSLMLWKQQFQLGPAIHNNHCIGASWSYPATSLSLGCCPAAKWERRVEKWCLILMLLENTLSVHKLTIPSWYRVMGWGSWDKTLGLNWNVAG